MYETLKSAEQADRLIDGTRPVWLLKHSGACSLSGWALREFNTYLEAHPGDRGAVVTVQQHHDVSSHVAHRLHVAHQSPQLLLVRRGRVLWQASHSQITAEAMEARRAIVTTG